MKRNVWIALGVLVTFATVPSIVDAQQKKTEAGKAIEKTGKAVEKGAKVVGNKTAEVAVKGAVKIADQTYKGRMAPDGSNVYIDGKNKKYYVNKKGAKIYLRESQIRLRPRA